MTNAWPRTALFSLVVIGIAFIQFHASPGREFNSDRSEEVWISTDGTAGPYSCPFRDYQNDSNRLYGLSSAPIYPEAFLRRGFYIYGKPPILLPVVGTKVCSRSATSQMDGTNPSLVSVDRLRSFLSPNYSIPPQAKYLVSTTFKDVHQCNYEGVKRSRDEYPLIPGRQQRKEVDLLWLDSNFRNLQETHVWIAPNATVHYDADDVRIFTHGNNLWMTYKVFNEDEGMSRMGGSSQRLNRIEFEQRGKHLIATADPSNVIEICCGRNFGFVPPLKSDEEDLSSITFLTWPDPVWAQSVELERLLGGNSFPANKPRYVEFHDPKVNKSHHPSPKNSHYHGTSNQLLYVQEWDEYLGVGHIHRNRRARAKKRVDAAFGHHYTHSFFTISAQAPFRMKQLSQEFVFQSQYNDADADVIQFASGLEWSNTEGSEKAILIGYGINDCEGAILRIQWDVVTQLLRPVANGTGVTDYMKGNLTREDFWK